MNGFLAGISFGLALLSVAAVALLAWRWMPRGPALREEQETPQ